MQSKNLNPIETCFGCIMRRSRISFESFNFYTFKELVKEISWASKKKKKGRHICLHFANHLDVFAHDILAMNCLAPNLSNELFCGHPLQFESPSVKVSSRDSCLISLWGGWLDQLYRRYSTCSQQYKLWAIWVAKQVIVTKKCIQIKCLISSGGI